MILSRWTSLFKMKLIQHYFVYTSKYSYLYMLHKSKLKCLCSEPMNYWCGRNDH